MRTAPEQVCQGDPCWCGRHPEVTTPDGFDPYTPEAREKFLAERRTQHRRRVGISPAFAAPYGQEKREQERRERRSIPDRIFSWWSKLVPTWSW